MTPLRARLGRVGARLGPGTGGFLSWWGQSLAAWLPRRWRRLLGLDRGRLLLSPDVSAPSANEDDVVLQLWREDGDGLRDLGRRPLPAEPDEALGDLPRWLLLPATNGPEAPRGPDR